MEISCPNCLAQLNSDDPNQSLECVACGHQFVPSAQSGDDDLDFPPLGSVPMTPQKAPPSTDLPGLESVENQSTVPPVQEDLALGANFEESSEAFKDIREFGSTLINGSEPEVESAQNNPPPLESETPTIVPSMPQAPVSAATATSGDQRIIVSASQIQGHTIKSYFSPVSVRIQLSTDSSDPLSIGYSELWERARALGAAALIDVKWESSADLSYVLISATPVAL